MPIQEQVQKTLDELVASGAELGVQVVTNRDGVKVVDAVAGLTAPDGSPVTAGTVFANFFVGKGAMSPWCTKRSIMAPFATTRPWWSVAGVCCPRQGPRHRTPRLDPHRWATRHPPRVHDVGHLHLVNHSERAFQSVIEDHRRPDADRRN
jgi:hypothetical protein